MKLIYSIFILSIVNVHRSFARTSPNKWTPTDLSTAKGPLPHQYRNGHLRSFDNSSAISERSATRALVENDGIWVKAGNDIEGKQLDSQFGDSVAISTNGNVIAVGARFKNGSNGTNTGIVRVYSREISQDDDVQWIQKGDDIEGKESGDYLGKSLALSNDGSTIVTGSPKSSPNGIVRAFKFDNSDNQWKEMGEGFGGETMESKIGCFVSLSGGGTTFAISWNDDEGAGLGVLIFKFEDDKWVERSTGHLSLIKHENCPSIALSEDGNILAVGGNEISDSNEKEIRKEGRVRVYQVIEEKLTALGQVIDEEENFGSSLSLSDDGRTLAASWNNTVRIYQLENATWKSHHTISHDGAYSNSQSLNRNTFGKSISLSGDGTKVVVGDSEDFKYCVDDICSDGPGSVQVFELSEDMWYQLGSTIHGRFLGTGARLGFSVALSQDGQSLVAGGPHRHLKNEQGYASVYDLKYPTESPSISPSLEPSAGEPTAESPAVDSPTITSAPSSSPSALPSTAPSSKPSKSPTSSPSISPSETPSSKPTKIPTLYPTLPPTPAPTQNPTPSPTEYKPNLIMILTDEHNFRTLSCYRDYLVSKVGRKSTDVWGDATRLDTPNIDTLASEGAMYTNFYTVAPLCTPSRASFMTGMYPAFTGDSALNHGAMDSNMKTFAEVLQEERGYRTGYFGKWHLDGEPSPGWGDNGRQFGFEENKYRFNRGHFKWIDEVDENMNGYGIEDEWRFQGRKSEHFTTDFLMDRGIEFMQKSTEKNEPFAMVISIPDPHGPNDNRDYYRDMFKDRHFEFPETAKMAMSFNPAAPGWNHFDLDEVPLDDVDEYVTEYENNESWQITMQQYYGMVKCIDANLGKLMRAIKNAGIDDDTIIVFTSDHGDLLMEHGKDNKGRPYETAAGIPFLVRFPGTVPAAKVIETAHSSVDFAPTILSLMGVPADGTGIDFQGVDGSEELLSEDSSTSTFFTSNKYEEKIIFSIDSGKTPTWAMAQMGWYKFVVSKGGIPYLFDLLLDPNEVYNYVNSDMHRDVLAKLQGALITALFEFDFPLVWYANNIYLDLPACYDKSDILPLTNGRLARCNDIGTIVNFKKCQNQAKIQSHCASTCGSCCVDTVGKMIVEKKLYDSCSKLKAAGKCVWEKVKSFCPVTCKSNGCGN